MEIVKVRGKLKNPRDLIVSATGWVYGYLTPFNHAGYIGKSDEVCIHTGIVDVYEVDPKTVGRFCDCEDAEGNKVYEGDKFSPDENNGETERQVVWNDKTLQWEMWIYGITYHTGEGGQEVYNDEPELIETEPLSYENTGLLVVGNIHDKTS